jgi:hypothetical protein
MRSAWIKIPYTIFVCVLVPVYWVERGPANFLWLSDIALLATVPALWMENRFLTSMMAVGVLLPELAWNMDFFLRLITGFDVIGLNGTGYMFGTRYTSLFKFFSRICADVVDVGTASGLLYSHRSRKKPQLGIWYR